MSIVNNVCPSFSPFTGYNCDLTTIPPDLDSKAWKFESDKSLVTSCFIQFKEKFCSKCLPQSSASFWLDRCVLKGKIEESRNDKLSGPINKGFKNLGDFFGNEKAAFYLLIILNSQTDTTDLKKLLKNVESEKNKKLVQFQIALSENKVDEALQIKEEIQGNEEQVFIAFCFFQYHLSLCQFDQARPYLFYLNENQFPKELSIDLLKKGIYPCSKADEVDKIEKRINFRDQKGDFYFDLEERKSLFNQSFQKVFLSFLFTYVRSDEERKENIKELVSIFEKLGDSLAEFVFVEMYIDYLNINQDKETAILAAEMVKNDQDRLTLFHKIYKSFRRR